MKEKWEKEFWYIKQKMRYKQIIFVYSVMRN